VPATVQAVLAARIDWLPPEAKRLLQTAAVLGMEVPGVLLQAIEEMPAETLRLSLTHLQATEFVYETRLFPELEYTFKHPLTREVAYGRLLHVGALPHLPETRDTREQAINLRLALRSALQPSGDLGRFLTHLREAESLAAALDAPRRLAQVLGFLPLHFTNRGAYDQAISVAQHALILATAGGDVVLQASANLYLGIASRARSDYRRAIACFGQTVAFFDGARRRERFGQVFLPAVLSRACLAWCHAELGRFAEGCARRYEGLQIAEAVAQPGSLVRAYCGLSLLSLRQGTLPRVLPLLEQAVGICQEVDFPILSPFVAAALGAAYTLGGTPQTACHCSRRPSSRALPRKE
jgi:tetratricopeptide (TPR) repeat protein